MSEGRIGRIKCPACGGGEFNLDRSDIHIYAYCTACGEQFVDINGGKVAVKTLIDEQCAESATDKQITGIKRRIYNQQYAQSLSRVDAGDIIGIFERSILK